MSISLCVEVNGAFIYANYLSTNMKKILDDIDIPISGDFTGTINFKEIPDCVKKLLSLIKDCEKEIELSSISDRSEAWLARYKEVLCVFTTAYMFGKDVTYA